MQIVDSHTEGEPTRVILEGGPDLGSGSLVDKAKRLADDFKDFYRPLVSEPYGQEAMVGALLVEPINKECVTGVIFFDAAAVIGMCGHGTIGVAVTLAHLGRIDIGTHKIETPAGIVTVTLSDKNTVTLQNIDSYRYKHKVTVSVGDVGDIIGDIAYGGNWFFMVNDTPIPVMPNNIRKLTDLGIATREAIYKQGLEGKNGQIIDHIVFFGAALSDKGHTRNFVLCPDNAYDRSPCGTASSARLACLAAEGVLAPGKTIIQESIIGSSYSLNYELATKHMLERSANGNPLNIEEGDSLSEKSIIPFISGQAFVTRISTLMNNPNDSLRHGTMVN